MFHEWTKARIINYESSKEEKALKRFRSIG